MSEDVDLLLTLADDVAGQIDDVVLFGMGVSSLAPEVYRRSFGGERFHVLDTTHPAAIRRVQSALDLERSFSSRRRSRGRRSRRGRTPTTLKLAPAASSGWL